MFSRFLLKLVISMTFLLGFASASWACDNPNCHCGKKCDCEKHDKAVADPAKVASNEVVAADEGMETKVLGNYTYQVEKPKEVAVEAKKEDIDLPLKVVEFVLTDKVEGREPKNILESFTQQDGRAYAFARLNAKEHAQVTFVWLLEGKEHARFTSNVQTSKRWRTYSSVRLKPGNWTAQLMVKGEVLAERNFVVK